MYFHFYDYANIVEFVQQEGEMPVVREGGLLT